MIPYRLALELTYQLDRSAERERLAKILSSIPVFLVFQESGGHEIILEFWKRLGQEGFQPESFYLASIADISPASAALLGDALKHTAFFFGSRGAWQRQESLLKQLLALAVERKDRERILVAHTDLGLLYTQRSNYAEALEHLKVAVALATELNDTKLLARSIGRIGLVQSHRSHFQEALGCFSQQLELSEQLNDLNGIANAHGSMANVFADQERYEDAIKSYEMGVAFCRRIGDTRGAAVNIGNVGLVYWAQAEHGKAMECYKQQLSMCEPLGDLRGMALALGNMGVLYSELGANKDAIDCFERTVGISTALNDKRMLSNAIGNIGIEYERQGDRERALPYLLKALSEARAVEYIQSLAIWYRGIARIIRDAVQSEVPGYISDLLTERSYENSVVGALQFAWDYAAESRKIGEDTANTHAIVTARVLLATLDWRLGRPDVAVATLEELLSGAGDAEEFAEYHYWLWKIKADEYHRTEALRHYLDCYRANKRVAFSQRIAELQGEPVPMSADDLEATH